MRVENEGSKISEIKDPGAKKLKVEPENDSTS